MRCFYSNFSQNRLAVPIKTYFYKPIIFDESVISTVTGVPNTGVIIYHHKLSTFDHYPEGEDMYSASLLIRGRVVEKGVDSVLANDLTLRSRVIAKILSLTIIPKKGGRDRYPEYFAVAIYCILKGIKINFPHLVCKIMNAYQGNSKNILPYGQIITLLMHHFKIPLSGFPSINPEESFSSNNLHLMHYKKHDIPIPPDLLAPERKKKEKKKKKDAPSSSSSSSAPSHDPSPPPSPPHSSAPASTMPHAGPSSAEPPFPPPMFFLTPPRFSYDYDDPSLSHDSRTILRATQESTFFFQNALVSVVNFLREEYHRLLQLPPPQPFVVGGMPAPAPAMPSSSAPPPPPSSPAAAASSQPSASQSIAPSSASTVPSSVTPPVTWFTTEELSSLVAKAAEESQLSSVFSPAVLLSHQLTASLPSLSVTTTSEVVHTVEGAASGAPATDDVTTPRLPEDPVDLVSSPEDGDDTSRFEIAPSGPPEPTDDAPTVSETAAALASVDVIIASSAPGSSTHPAPSSPGSDLDGLDIFDDQPTHDAPPSSQ